MTSPAQANARSEIAWKTLAAVLGIEVLGGVVIVIAMLPTFPEVGPERDAFLPLWFSLLASVVACWAWALVTCIGSLRSRTSRVRSSALTLHLLVVAAALGVLQGLLGEGYFVGGWIAIILGLIGFVAAILVRPRLPELVPDTSEV